MGHIKEPAGIDLNLDPMPLTVEDLQLVSSLIAEYKLTKQVPGSKPKSAKVAPAKKVLVAPSKKRKSTTPKNIVPSK